MYNEVLFWQLILVTVVFVYILSFKLKWMNIFLGGLLVLLFVFGDYRTEFGLFGGIGIDRSDQVYIAEFHRSFFIRTRF